MLPATVNQPAEGAGLRLASTIAGVSLAVAVLLPAFRSSVAENVWSGDEESGEGRSQGFIDENVKFKVFPYSRPGSLAGGGGAGGL